MNNPNFRALCAELLEALENAIRVIYREDGTQHISTADDVITRADAALAAEPEQGHSLREISDWILKCKQDLKGNAWTDRVEHHDALAIVAAALHDLGAQPTLPLPMNLKYND